MERKEDYLSSSNMNSSALETKLLGLVKDTIIADASRGDRSQSIHVTQLNRGCLRQTWYEINTPRPPLDYEKAAIFRLGHMVHAGLTLSDMNEVHLGANIRTQKVIKTKDINKINFYDCVTGTADDILQIDGETIIVDKKTTNGVPKEASKDYVFQLNVYKLLYFIKTGVDVKKGAIVYLNKIDSFKTVAVFEVPLLPVDEIRAEVLRRLDVIHSEAAPDRVISKRCEYCPFKNTVCHPEQAVNYSELIKEWK